MRKVPQLGQNSRTFGRKAGLPGLRGSVPSTKEPARFRVPDKSGRLFHFRAEDGSRTRNLQLGRLELYQLSYFRLCHPSTKFG
jgi:hypothetical protein